MSEKIEAGSVVQLKSGGSPMTVRSVDTEGQGDPNILFVWCDWFEKGNMKSGHFPLTSVELVETPPLGMMG